MLHHTIPQYAIPPYVVCLNAQAGAGRYKIPEQCRLDMTAKDIETGKALLQQDFIKDRPEWCKVLCHTHDT